MVKSSAVFGAFFKGKRVFITGHTGFKGSWLSVWLVQMGARVTGFALPPQTERDHFTVLGLDRRIDHHVGDIRNLEQLHQAMSASEPEIVFHLAAQPLVRLSYAEPKVTFETNVGGSVNLLEAVRQCASVRVLVYITSDKCYKNREWVWGYRENDELGGHDPYSASKACAELVFSAYLDSFFRSRADFGAASARGGNVIGGGDWASDRIVPDCIRALEKKEPIVVRNPEATRPWQHVLEPLNGYLLLAERLWLEPRKYSGPWNFGPGKESNRTVRELVEKALAVWGGGKALFGTPAETAQPHEAHFLHLNCDKAYQELGWRPTWAFERSVEETVRWYAAYLKGLNVWDLATKAIIEFENHRRASPHTA